MLTLAMGGVSFLLGERKWQHQNVKQLHLLAQNAKSVIIQQARIQQQIQKELKLQNSVQDVAKEQFTKKQNNLLGDLCQKTRNLRNLKSHQE